MNGLSLLFIILLENQNNIAISYNFQILLFRYLEYTYTIIFHSQLYLSIIRQTLI